MKAEIKITQRQLDAIFCWIVTLLKIILVMHLPPTK